MTIKLVDLKAQYVSIKDEIRETINKVLDNSSFILGENVKKFEEEFANYCGVKYAIGVCSGTSALHLALLACGIGKGDEVITVPNTFIATTEAISQTGAKIVFTDIDEKTYNLDISKIEGKITPQTKAIIPVHLYGQSVKIDCLLDLSKKYGLKVIEDTAQSQGAEYNGKKLGVFGEVGCFSFYPGKNLGAYGDAGMIITNDESIANTIRLLRNHGRKERYVHLIEGYNCRLDEIQAAVLRVKLKYLDKWNELRRQKASIYGQLLKDLVILPEGDSKEHVYHLFVIRTKHRDGLKEYLKSQGIETGIHYPLPLHLQEAYKHLNYNSGDFPVAESCAKEILSLPIYPELSEEKQVYIAEKIKEFMEKG